MSQFPSNLCAGSRCSGALIGRCGKWGFGRLGASKTLKGWPFGRLGAPKVLKGNFWAFGRFGAPKALKGSFWAFGRFGAPETLKGNFCKKSRNTLGSLQLRFVVHSQKRR